jgi:hypothetical protein
LLLESIHTLTLGSTAVRAWTVHFRNVGAVLPHLKSLILVNAWLELDSDVAVLKRDFGNTLLSLSLNRVSIDPTEFYPILSSFPNLDNLSIAYLDLPHQHPSDNISACPRTRGKLTLVGVEAHDTCVPFLLRLPIQFRALYFYDTWDVRKIYPLVRACSSTLTTLDIRGSVFPFVVVITDSKQRGTDDAPRMGGYEAPLISQGYPELQTICFALAALADPRGYVSLVLSSITSAPKLSEVLFIFTRTILDQDIDIVVNLAGWGPVDDQLCRLAQQATGGVTASFDLLTAPGWTPRRDITGMSFMQRFRRFGVMRLRSFGKDMATYCPIHVEITDVS